MGHSVIQSLLEIWGDPNPLLERYRRGTGLVDKINIWEEGQDAFLPLQLDSSTASHLKLFHGKKQ